MKNKYLIIMILLLTVIYSCKEYTIEIETLKKQITELEDKLINDNKTIISLKNINLENEQIIDDLKTDLSNLDVDSIYELTTDEYSFDSFLVKDINSLLPNGFTTTTGYIADMRHIQVREDNDNESFSFNPNSGYLVFFVTDKFSEIYRFLSDIVNNDLIYKDKNGNICLPIVDNKNYTKGISRDIDNPSTVLLTLHRMPNIALEFDVIPFGSVYLTR